MAAPEYMDPNRPKRITPPPSANPPAPSEGPGKEGGDGMWPADSNANRGTQGVPVGKRSTY